LTYELIAAKKIPKEELVACVPFLLSAAEDRSAEVRKNAQEALLPVMIHVGYESMLKASTKLSVRSFFKLRIQILSDIECNFLNKCHSLCPLF
jgi:hypothetical protein